MGRSADSRLTDRKRMEDARRLGYEDEPCTNCDEFTLVRTGSQLKCDSCGKATDDRQPVDASGLYVYRDGQRYIDLNVAAALLLGIPIPNEFF